jgi:hypothetical protein
MNLQCPECFFSGVTLLKKVKRLPTLRHMVWYRVKHLSLLNPFTGTNFRITISLVLPWHEQIFLNIMTALKSGTVIRTQIRFRSSVMQSHQEGAEVAMRRIFMFPVLSWISYLWQKPNRRTMEDCSLPSDWFLDGNVRNYCLQSSCFHFSCAIWSNLILNLGSKTLFFDWYIEHYIQLSSLTTVRSFSTDCNYRMKSECQFCLNWKRSTFLCRAMHFNI